MPNVGGSAQPMTHFKGPKREAKKQCVLILNHDTGEITLERLNHDVVLKRQRLDGTSKAYIKTPIPPSATASTSSVEKGATSSSTTSSTGVSQSSSTSSAQDMGPTLPSQTQIKKTLKKKKSKQPTSAAIVPADEEDDVSTKSQLQPPSSKPPSRPLSNGALPTPLSNPLSSSNSASASRSDPESSALAAKSVASKLSPVNRLSSSSSSSSSSSDNSSGPDSDNEDSRSSSTVARKSSPPASTSAVVSRPAPTATQLDYKSLQDDLRLSESGSDSD